MDISVQNKGQIPGLQKESATFTIVSAVKYGTRPENLHKYNGELMANLYQIKSYGRELDAMSTSMMDRTVAIIAAYISHNQIPFTNLPDEIQRIHTALMALQSGAGQAPAPVLPTRSAIADSIRHDRLVSFIDGKAYKSLKRHLTAKGMTPGEYRSRYGLPSDYPMVSPSYAKLRSRIAKKIQAVSKAT